MKHALVFLLLALLAGCAAVITPHGVYIEPLPVSVVIGPPMVVEGPPVVVYERLRPLPPVVLAPDRYIYFHEGYYYYFWGGIWYFSPERSGPWYKLPPKYYPPRVYKEHPQPRGRPFRDY